MLLNSTTQDSGIPIFARLQLVNSLCQSKYKSQLAIQLFHIFLRCSKFDIKPLKCVFVSYYDHIL